MSFYRSRAAGRFAGWNVGWKVRLEADGGGAYRGPSGGMVEWFKAPVLKTGVGASSPWVRIPLPPPYFRSRVYERSPGARLNLAHTRQAGVGCGRFGIWARQLHGSTGVYKAAVNEAAVELHNRGGI